MTKFRGMVLGAFVGDALALGAHWIYNVDDIKKKFGRISDLTAPEAIYHDGKVKGDYTHYGDQALMVLQYLKLNRRIEDQEFYDFYENYMIHYKGYKDHATKETLMNLKNGMTKGSNSGELGGFVRFPGIIYLNQKQVQVGIDQAVLLTKLTHQDPVLLDRSTFLAKLLYQVLKGDEPTDAIKALKKDASKQIYDDIEKAKSMLSYPATQAIKQFGQSCDSNNAFPAVLYFIMKYQDHFSEALIENVMAGGDSAARGMVIGGILGAYHGEKEIPVNWLAGMNQLKTLESLLQK
ncbi:ADP-ribosylglycohydrolase family protein [Acidaminobacter sp. JC074]|uniref:ADP-ribosylglycohydrolase family protein n=1 Tax=Acidaminobacter sp. JC074 TaxID=2530199 RepID=UPI001F0DC83C|nr:ADP-ribosylglycohydrolase family protein [Acidaminobacter sp. JC074]MCH4887584.1 ADP-ribosylglycohydrolase family protein [Acidaminobacter sp. JC074]